MIFAKSKAEMINAVAELRETLGDPGVVIQ